MHETTHRSIVLTVEPRTDRTDFAYWLAHPDRGWLSQYMMWTPGVAGLLVQALRREPPRTMGFHYTGAAPWLAAFFYPIALIAACIAIAYALRFVSGADVIHFQPEAMHFKVFGVAASGLGLVPLRFARSLLLMTPWLAVALAYRYELPERLGAGRHLARAALWAGVFWFNPGPWWLPPGGLGEAAAFLLSIAAGAAVFQALFCGADRSGRR
jgi:hypothetical protein